MYNLISFQSNITTLVVVLIGYMEWIDTGMSAPKPRLFEQICFYLFYRHL